MSIAKNPVSSRRTLPSALTFAQVWASYRRYESLLPALPTARLIQRVPGIRELISKFDTFVFDAYGIVNRGHQAIAGAAQQFANVIATGKPVVARTNDDSGNREAVLAKHAARGFGLAKPAVIAGLGVLSSRLAALGDAASFGFLGPSSRPHEKKLKQLE